MKVQGVFPLLLSIMPDYADCLVKGHSMHQAGCNGLNWKWCYMTEKN